MVDDEATITKYVDG